MLKEIPFLRIVVPYASGIVTGLYFIPGRIFFIAILTVLLILLVISKKYNRSIQNHFFGLWVLMAFFLAGLSSYDLERSQLSTLNNEFSYFSCTVSDYPEEKGYGRIMKVRLNLQLTDSCPKSLRGNMMVTIMKAAGRTDFLPGDNVIIRCKPEPITDRGNPFGFNYSFYMQNHGTKYSSVISGRDILLHNAPAHRSLAHKALMIRSGIIAMFRERGISDENIGLVSAVTLGEKSQLDNEQKENFIKAGVMHVMAVSGLHAVILSVFLFNLLFFMKGRLNSVRVIITILFIWIFAFVTGLTPSVLRASLMFSFIQAGNLMKRRVDGVNSILASAFVLMVIRPSVIFDAGFLLSYSAVLFIIVFYQPLYSLVQFRRYIPDKLWQSAVVTIVAQMGTLPLTIMLFNRLPVYFLLTNMIIIPLTSLMIVLGCLLPVFYPVGFISSFIALILNRLTELTAFITEKVAFLPYASIGNLGMPAAECIILFILIFTIGCLMFKRHSISPAVPLSVLAIYALVLCVREIHTRSTNELIVYNTPGSCVTGLRTGRFITLYSQSFPVPKDVARHSSALGLRVKEIRTDGNPVYLEACQTRILICNTVPSYSRMASELKPDIIVCIHGMSSFASSGGARIIMGENKPYDVRSSGAFRFRLAVHK